MPLDDVAMGFGGRVSRGFHLDTKRLPPVPSLCILNYWVEMPMVISTLGKLVEAKKAADCLATLPMCRVRWGGCAGSGGAEFRVRF
jgi:hypothetical protein